MYQVRPSTVAGIRYGHVWDTVTKRYVVSWLPLANAEGLARVLNEKER